MKRHRWLRESAVLWGKRRSPYHSRASRTERGFQNPKDRKNSEFSWREKVRFWKRCSHHNAAAGQRGRQEESGTPVLQSLVLPVSFRGFLWATPNKKPMSRGSVAAGQQDPLWGPEQGAEWPLGSGRPAVPQLVRTFQIPAASLTTSLRLLNI